MKLVSYLKEEHEQLALLVNDILYDANRLHPELPSTMSMFLNYWDDYYPLANAINESILEGKISLNKGVPPQSVQLLAPVPQPASCRVGNAFGRRLHMQQTSEEQSETAPPVFHFSNHHSIQGTGQLPCMADHLRNLHCGIEVAIVICKQGRNIRAADADEYIAGYMIMSNFTSRSYHSNPALSIERDVSKATGPWLVTPDELETFRADFREGHEGKSYDLSMQCVVNGIKVCAGKMSDMDFTFAEIIEQCAYGADIYPGDIISSGTMNLGKFKQPDASGEQNDGAREQSLREGDAVLVEIESLGTLENTIVADENDFSLLAATKPV